MSCTCNCIKVNSKVLSKLNRSSKHTDHKDSQKLNADNKADKQQFDSVCGSLKDNCNLQDNCLESEQGGLTIEQETTQQTEMETSENVQDEQTDDLTALKTSGSKNKISTDKAPQRRRSTVDRIRDFFVPPNRRDAICDEMEKNLENSGLSLRQYRKILATTSVLQELKML